jgi:hypothetical protein
MGQQCSSCNCNKDEGEIEIVTNETKANRDQKSTKGTLVSNHLVAFQYSQNTIFITPEWSHMFCLVN